MVPEDELSGHTNTLGEFRSREEEVRKPACIRAVASGAVNNVFGITETNELDLRYSIYFSKI